MKNNPYFSFYSIAFRQKYIRRWGLMRNINSENLSEHSAEVAMITHALAVIGNTMFGKSYDVGQAVTAALFHDVPEVYTGDLPTPVKYFNENMRENYKVIENNAIEKLLNKLPEEMRCAYNDIFYPDDSEIIKLVKISDKLCAYIKCVEEEKSGNNEFVKAKESLLNALKEYTSCELDYFISNFLPAFELTLDEM
jgi:Predicted hydrolases of HD superfamily